MTNKNRPLESRAYEPPTITPVYIDPVRDLLAVCGKNPSDNGIIQACTPTQGGSQIS